MTVSYVSIDDENSRQKTHNALIIKVCDFKANLVQVATYSEREKLEENIAVAENLALLFGQKDSTIYLCLVDLKSLDLILKA